jgi:hypothetical protein
MVISDPRNDLPRVRSGWKDSIEKALRRMHGAPAPLPRPVPVRVRNEPDFMRRAVAKMRSYER